MSSSHISHVALQRMDVFLTDFIRDVDPLVLAQEEQTSGNFWSVFEPFVTLLYVPTPLEGSREGGERELLLQKMRTCSVQSALIALHIIILCSDDGHKSLDIICRENLLPYIILAPVHVPVSLRSQASEVVRCLGQHVQIEPPTLADLAKASLAKYQFGLERLLHLRTPHELVQEYYGV